MASTLLGKHYIYFIITYFSTLVHRKQQKKRDFSHFPKGILQKGRKKQEKNRTLLCAVSGADYGDRTRHLNLGKVALYQMS